jgi:hypothetical protein
VAILSNLASRRPPKIDPNWRTTYRLNCGALVAIVRLSSTKQTLTNDLQIQWAEVVPTDPMNPNNDWNARSKGRIAVRLLSQFDCSMFPGDADQALDVQQPVAIIDLRVFVKEVIPVLATFANVESFTQHIVAIPFIDKMIGSAPPIDDKPVIDFGIESSPDQAIRKAIELSNIEYLTRLTPAQKERIIVGLTELTKNANLYGTQLEAFLYGLSCSVHCLQGPPGTGKVCHIQIIVNLFHWVFLTWVFRRVMSEFGLCLR